MPKNIMGQYLAKYTDPHGVVSATTIMTEEDYNHFKHLQWIASKGANIQPSINLSCFSFTPVTDETLAVMKAIGTINCGEQSPFKTLSSATCCEIINKENSLVLFDNGPVKLRLYCLYIKKCGEAVTKDGGFGGFYYRDNTIYKEITSSTFKASICPLNCHYDIEITVSRTKKKTQLKWKEVERDKEKKMVRMQIITRGYEIALTIYGESFEDVLNAFGTEFFLEIERKKIEEHDETTSKLLKSLIRDYNYRIETDDAECIEQRGYEITVINNQYNTIFVFDNSDLDIENATHICRDPNKAYREFYLIHKDGKYFVEAKYSHLRKIYTDCHIFETPLENYQHILRQYMGISSSEWGKIAKCVCRNYHDNGNKSILLATGYHNKCIVQFTDSIGHGFKLSKDKNGFVNEKNTFMIRRFGRSFGSWGNCTKSCYFEFDITKSDAEKYSIDIEYVISEHPIEVSKRCLSTAWTVTRETDAYMLMETAGRNKFGHNTSYNRVCIKISKSGDDADFEKALKLFDVIITNDEQDSEDPRFFDKESADEQVEQNIVDQEYFVEEIMHHYNIGLHDDGHHESEIFNNSIFVGRRFLLVYREITKSSPQIKLEWHPKVVNESRIEMSPWIDFDTGITDDDESNPVRVLLMVKTHEVHSQDKPKDVFERIFEKS